MTIAGIYLAPEGVVFGADSTASIRGSDGYHFFDHNQKIFEIGEDSSIGLVTWGLGAFGDTSYRTLIAELSDDLLITPPKATSEVADRWTSLAWAAYCTLPEVQYAQTLGAKAPHIPHGAPSPNVRTEPEELELVSLKQNLAVGFCIAGWVGPSRRPHAFSISFDPSAPVPPTSQSISMGSMAWWGVPNFFSRLLFGIDGSLLENIANSGKWSGTRPELDALVSAHHHVPTTNLPIRDAIDFVHTCIHCTIKAIKFSGLPQVCGGPIELAVVTSDRKFRWVRHKAWDAAIADGATV